MCSALICLLKLISFIVSANPLVHYNKYYIIKRDKISILRSFDRYNQTP